MEEQGKEKQRNRVKGATVATSAAQEEGQDVEAMCGGASYRPCVEAEEEEEEEEGLLTVMNE